MTDQFDEEHVLDNWLTSCMAAMDASLDHVLDLPAGLADACLPSRYASLTEALGPVLDLEAGLTAILSPEFASATSRAEQPMPRTGSPLWEFANILASKPPPERLAARAWLPLTQLANIRATAVIQPLVRDRFRDLSRDLTNTYGVVQSLALRIARFLREGPGISNDLGEQEPRRATGDAPRLAATLDCDLVNVRGIADALNRQQAHAPAEELDIVRAISRVADLERILAHALRVSRDLDFILKLALDLDHVHVHVPARDCDRLRGLVGELAHAHASAEDFDLARAFTDAIDSLSGLDDALHCDLEDALRRALVFERATDDTSVAQAQHDRTLISAIKLIDRSVTEFTGADLSDANLRDIPLDGLCWSRTTQWPLEWQHWVNQNSVSIGTDLWEIRTKRLPRDTRVVAPT